jgi:hypothetical protein
MNEETTTVTLTLDNDETMECLVLTILNAGERQYIALLPLTEDGEPDDADVFLYRYIETPDGEPQLDNIEDDEEYDLAADKFDEWLDTQEFEFLDDEE